MPVLRFENCDLTNAGPLRDWRGNLVEWDVSDGGIYTVQVVPLGPTLFSTAVLELKKSNAMGAPRKSLASPHSFTNTATTHLTGTLSPEAAVKSIDVTTGEASRRCDVFVWILPAAPSVVGP